MISLSLEAPEEHGSLRQSRAVVVVCCGLQGRVSPGGLSSEFAVAGSREVSGAWLCVEMVRFQVTAT
jgi:hypothetical protein